MWDVNSFDIKNVDNLFQTLCEKNPLINEKYEQIIDAIKKEYAKYISGEIYCNCLILEKDAYTFEDGEGYYGYPILVRVSDQKQKVQDVTVWEHRLMLVMYDDEPMDLVEINHCAMKYKAKVYQFPNIKRQPREFFLKDPK